MNCQAAEQLLLAERDGVLTNEQHAALSRHADGCASCRQLRLNLAAAMAAVRDDAANLAVPDADEEWRLLQLEMRAAARRERLGGGAPAVIKWVGAPMAAAAALTLAFYVGRTMPLEPTRGFSVAAEARVDFVEVADTDATPIVFLDNESGWLVVWAAESESTARGSASI